MADKSKIEWTDATWNPIRGCSVVSEGCRNCYAMRDAARFSGPGQAYEGLAYRNASGAHWTGEVRLIEEHLLDPLRWKRPRRIFVNSMSDLFHEFLNDRDIFRVFGVMERSPHHTFQVLTKRPKRMKEFIDWLTGFYERLAYVGLRWPIKNIWLGVSVEDQKTADERIPLLIETPAAVRWISAEPLLGPIDMQVPWSTLNAEYPALGIHWVVVGGESGPKARPMHPDWARSLRDQCVAAGVPFFFKQWGEWSPEFPRGLSLAHRQERYFDRQCFYRIGKHAAGRLLDGREWSQYPEASAA